MFYFVHTKTLIKEPIPFRPSSDIQETSYRDADWSIEFEDPTTSRVAFYTNIGYSRGERTRPFFIAGDDKGKPHAWSGSGKPCTVRCVTDRTTKLLILTESTQRPVDPPSPIPIEPSTPPQPPTPPKVFNTITDANQVKFTKLAQDVKFGQSSERVYTPIASFDENVFVIEQYDLKLGVSHIKPDGTRVSVLIDPDYRWDPDPHNRHALGIDELGYIHIAGNVHNGPPQSLLKKYSNCTIVYWRSKRPLDITEFEYLGNVSARTIPCDQPTYGSFQCDRNGKLFFSCRIRGLTARSHVPGFVGYAIFKYDTKTLKWTNIGGTLNGRATMLNIKGGHSDVGGWYQLGMSTINFDAQNRLHFAIDWCCLPERKGPTHVLYCCTTDEGKTWRKADGTVIPMPMTLETADVALVKKTDEGIARVTVDADGVPRIFTESMNSYVTWLPNENKWSDPTQTLNHPWWLRIRGYLTGAKQVLIPYHGNGLQRHIKVYSTWDSTPLIIKIPQTGSLFFTDPRAIQQENHAYYLDEQNAVWKMSW